ncbi:CLUMA_CG008595, isoform A [Clunio marinus]|uniref:CLUMA_CG008595, isoform A n=1 Tax=Clunio marinus TaxID=568069 RepID=A0A1J1I4A2_9DIPT|nr:CLUMA_CG008595, isoform A [Clunio marinus]
MDTKSTVNMKHTFICFSVSVLKTKVEVEITTVTCILKKKVLMLRPSVLQQLFRCSTLNIDENKTEMNF